MEGKYSPMSFQVVLYRRRCIACGYCVSLVPDIWMLSVHDGKVTHINHPDADDDIVNVSIEKGSRVIVKQSESICPVKAIKVLE